jgi:hypothetical protein
MMTKSLLEIQTMMVSFLSFPNLKFIGDGADFINLISELYVMAEIKLTKYERHPRTG